MSNCKFLLEINGITGDPKNVVGGFTKISGGNAECEVQEYAQGNDPHKRKRPGRKTYSNLVLEGGYTNDDFLWKWWEKVLKGETDIYRDGSVILLDDTGNEVGRWNFFESWPCKWDGPELDAESDAIMVEKVELAIERLEKA
ncbi:MAG: phage tail protein [Planctomycetes bacterium]|nr:phage tail protein [Planctomycetota bacterium]